MHAHCSFCTKLRKIHAKGQCISCYQKDMFSRNPASHAVRKRHQRAYYDKNKDNPDLEESKVKAREKYQKSKKFKKAREKYFLKQRYKTYLTGKRRMMKDGLIIIIDGERIPTPINETNPEEARKKLEIFKQVYEKVKRDQTHGES